jgi:hypothetical protein
MNTLILLIRLVTYLEIEHSMKDYLVMPRGLYAEGPEASAFRKYYD